MNINLGIDENKRREIVDNLGKVLANTYVSYLKTQNFHWNVTGSCFFMLHGMFEEQYQALAEAVDELAERIRALGFPTPASFSKFSQLATIKEENSVPDSKHMIQQLLQDHESICIILRELIAKAADVGDEATADLLTERLDEHEKTAWMLRSSL